jgi:hypothetical protein
MQWAELKSLSWRSVRFINDEVFDLAMLNCAK